MLEQMRSSCLRHIVLRSCKEVQATVQAFQHVQPFHPAPHNFFQDQQAELIQLCQTGANG